MKFNIVWLIITIVTYTSFVYLIVFNRFHYIVINVIAVSYTHLDVYKRQGTLSDYGSATGWTLYPPLSNANYHAGRSVDLVIFAIILACISSVITSSNFISTIITKKDRRVRLIKMSLIA